MAYTVFDGVAKFSADSSQLDQFIVQLEQGLTTASEKAAASTRELKSAQDEFRAAIKAVSAEGGDTAANLQLLAEAEKNLALAAAAAKQEHAALKASLTDTKEASGVATEAMGELTGKLTEMFGLMAAAEGFKALIEGTQQSVLQLQLLSEKTGIAINTLAGIQHVAESSGVSFESVSTALEKLSKNQVLAAEGGKAQETAFQRIGISVNELKQLTPEDLFYRVADAMANSKNHAEALASAQQLLGRGGAALIPIFEQNGEQLRGMVEEAAKASGVTKEAGLSALDWEKQTANLSEAFRAGLIPLMQQAVPLIKGLEAAGSEVALVIHDLTAVIGGLFFTFVSEAKGMGTIIDDVIHGHFGRLVDDAKTVAAESSQNLDGILSQFKENWQNSAEFIKGVWTEIKPLKSQEDDLSDLTAKTKNATKDQTELAKAALDEQLADIEKWKAGQHAAYATGQIDAASWKVAELQAVDAANVAHEDYLQKLVGIYTKAGQAAKAQATQEQLNALETKDQAKAVDDLAAAHEKYEKAVQKVVAEHQKLENTQIEKDFKATEKAALDLAKSEEEVAKAEGKLAETRATKDLAAQEQAIKDLAQLGLITEEQKAQKLRALYQQEENDAVAALRDTQQKLVVEAAKGNPLFGDAQLADLKKNLEAAKGDFAAGEKAIKASFAAVEKTNPFLTPAQITELQADLNKVLAAYTNTQTQITSTQDKYEKERIANQKGALGNAIAQAVAAGNTMLAEELKQHQAMLVAIQDQIALAKELGKDTSGLKAREKGIQDETSALMKQTQQVHTLSQAWTLFSADFAKKVKDNDSAAQEMAQSFTTAAQGMQTGIQSAFSAMVSGTESAGKAIEQAMFKTIGAIAAQWGAYFIAKGAADVVNPATSGQGAVELAEGAALEALAGILGGLASALGSSSKSSASSKTTASGSTSTSTTAASTSGPNPVQVQNVQSFAIGGLASTPTLAMIGDSEGGGAAMEAVIPLENQRALTSIADALVPALLRTLIPAVAERKYEPGATSALLSNSTLTSAGRAIEQSLAVERSGESPASRGTDMQAMASAIAKALKENTPPGGEIQISLESDIPQLVKRINHSVSTGRSRLLASNSIRVTRRS